MVGGGGVVCMSREKLADSAAMIRKDFEEFDRAGDLLG